MGLYKRGGVWWMRFNHQERQIRRSTETTNKRLAERIEAKVLTQMAEGKWFERSVGADKTLQDLFYRYISEHSSLNKAKRTARQDRGFAKEMLAFFGDVPITEISPSGVSAYKVHLRTKGLAAATINLQRGFLRHAFKKALLEWEWVRENPVEKVSSEKVSNARDRWLTLDEEKKLIDACVIYATGKGNVMAPHYWLQEIVVFALNTGMRQGEILSLSWPDVDLFKRTATVVRSKNGEKRTIPLNRKAFAVCKAKALGREITKGYVFASEVGTKILARNLHRAFCDAKKRAEIEDFRFHDLRHTFATRLAQAGIDLYKIAKLLGHKDIKMTQRYSHHYHESLRDGVEVLDGLVQEESTNIAQSKEKGLRDNP